MINFDTPHARNFKTRRLALACVLCAAPLAQAQTGSGVTLYGLADAGITSVSGLKAGTVTQLASGIMEGSRWGMKGNEDLGGGYKAIFSLESRVELDTGSNSSRPISGNQISDRFSTATLLGLPAAYQPFVNGVVGAAGAPGTLLNEYGVNVGTYGNRLFDRQAYVGLVTPAGAVLAGRLYTPAFETHAAYDIMETQSGLSSGQIVAFPAVLEIRKSNSLQYRFVKDGVSGALMYSLGDSGENANNSSKMFGLNANYKTGDFSVGLGYNKANNELGQASLTTSVLGASMQFGSDKLTGMVIKINDDNPSSLSGIAAALTPAATAALDATFGAGAGAAAARQIQAAYVNAFKQDGTLIHIGYRHVVGKNTISVAYSDYNDNRPANADVSSYGAAYTYALSKRTDLNAVWVRFNNKNLAQVAPGGNGYIGGVTATAGTDSTGIAFGIRHRF
ncbi:porin [Rhodoferax sp.]|uniref:porin n=1 Tax=Rhodoferax sp. TaxID=50421 RepID=UPI002636B74E|nr:porin [Rhodoferax sp.]MDD2811676.1 porin [Rhodoferax sp.]MDD5478956.1 porin [Rhodoferax sp.]